jgi:hypothetical protein
MCGVVEFAMGSGRLGRRVLGTVVDTDAGAGAGAGSSRSGP